MRALLIPSILILSLLVGCGMQPAATTSPASSSLFSAGSINGANAFNPYLKSSLPNTRKPTDEGQKMLADLGAAINSIEGEAAHRKNWREEIYPIVFGNANAPKEIIVILDFSSPQSEQVWKEVVRAAKSLSPQQCKIVVYGHSAENYGTDLMGLAIWIAHSRPGQVMPYLSYALNRWNVVKASQKSQGVNKKFVNEYDATASSADYPIHYAYLARLQPPVPANQELAVAKYCYDAGNVNMYQAVQVERFYGVSSLPAVIVDGRLLGRANLQNILDALK